MRSDHLQLLCITLTLMMGASSPLCDAQSISQKQSHADSRAWTTHTKDGQQYITENAKFQYVDLLNDDGNGYQTLRLLETDKTVRKDWQDEITGKVTVAAWPAIGKENQTPLWSFVAPGEEGRVFPETAMFQSISWPCCSAAFQNVYFSLHNGNRLYVTNGIPEKGSFGQDDGLIRIYHYDKTRYDTARFVAFGALTRESSNELPTLQYGTDRTIKQRFALRGHTYGDNFDVPHLSVTTDGKKLESQLTVNGQFSFTIVLHFDPSPYEEGSGVNPPSPPEYELRIPVEDDIVRIDKAILPAGYTLVALPSAPKR